MMTDETKYLLNLADTALIKSHRLQETLGHAPELEIDMALANIGLDQLGQSRFLYQYVAELLGNTDEDKLAMTRDAWDMYNTLIVELPNGNFADIIAKNFYSDHFTYLVYQSLTESSDNRVSAFAKKSIKELQYHVNYFDQWVIRLGQGTELSHERMTHAILNYWDYTGEFFQLSEYEKNLDPNKFPIDWNTLKEKWSDAVNKVLDEAGIPIPTGTWSHTGGKSGQHTEHLGYILADLQFMQKSYPNMEW